MPTDHPLFIYRYLDRTVTQNDSARFRNRVSAAFSGLPEDSVIAAELKAKAGLEPRFLGYGYDWDGYWKKAPMPDVLTAVSVSYRWTKGRGYTVAGKFHQAVTEALADENMGYTMDANGSIVFAVDRDFALTKTATLAGLDDPRFRDSRAAYEAAFGYMNKTPPNTRQAVRSAFEAVELVARQIAPEHKNLHAGLCRSQLKERCVPALTADSIEAKVLEAQFQAMSDWVSGVHFLRHGQPESAPPSPETSVFLLTTASAYLRLLCAAASRLLSPA